VGFDARELLQHEIREKPVYALFEIRARPDLDAEGSNTGCIG
jgi:hypothetical protein